MPARVWLPETVSLPAPLMLPAKLLEPPLPVSVRVCVPMLTLAVVDVPCRPLIFSFSSMVNWPEPLITTFLESAMVRPPALASSRVEASSMIVAPT